MAFRRRQILGMGPGAVEAFLGRVTADGGDTVVGAECIGDLEGDLVMYPTARKAGVLYSQKRKVLPRHAGYPSSPDDFTVVRNSVKWVMDANGVLVSVPINVPAFEWGLGALCPALKTEPQSANLALWSEGFDNAVWTKSFSSVTPNLTIAPNRELTADKIIEDATSNTHLIRQNFTAIIGEVYSYSVYVKKGERTFVRLSLFGVANSNADFDLNNGTLILKGSSITTANIKKRVDGWFKLDITYTETRTDSRVQIGLGESDVSYNYLGDGVSGLYAWGAQLEPLLTSYIKTEGATVTRLADEITDAGDVNTFNSEEGVLYVEMAALVDGGSFRPISISNGTNGKRIFLYFDSAIDNTIYAQIYTGSNNVYFIYELPNSITDFNKIALKWKINDAALWVNGLEVRTSTLVNVPSINTLNKLSFNEGAGGFRMEANTKAVKVFKRALTDNELYELTKP